MDDHAIISGDWWMGITTDICSTDGNRMDITRTFRKKAQAIILTLFLTSATYADIYGSRASFLMVDDRWMTLNYLHPNAEKLRMRAAAISNGDTHIYLYSRNGGDGFNGGPNFDLSIITPQPDWEVQLNTLNAAGLSPVMWLTPDDSPSITSQSLDAQKAHFSEVVRRFDDKVTGYVTCLECYEYWDAATVNALVAHLKSITDKPVGVHLTSGIGGHKGNKEYYANADYVYLQTGWDKTPAEITAMVKQAIAVTGKPVVASEYAKESRSAAARALGDAACLAGAIGTGNGRSVDFCGQREQKKVRWYEKYETEMVVAGVAMVTLYAVSRFDLPLQLRATEDGYQIGAVKKITKNQSIGLNYRDDGTVMAHYRIEF